MKNKKLTKNQRYERAKNEKGLEKITIWIPSHAENDFKEMAEFIREQYLLESGRRKLIPYMMRDIETGRNAGRIKHGES